MCIVHLGELHRKRKVQVLPHSVANARAVTSWPLLNQLLFVGFDRAIRHTVRLVNGFNFEGAGDGLSRSCWSLRAR